MSQITISIYVPTFNHERYIVRALDSIRMQKTDYVLEVFVGEDCSTDGTAQVLKAWEEANADDRFHIFYREKNMGGRGRGNAKDLKSRCKGDFIICLEGDDFWTDPEKLQKQVDFLVAHPDYYGVAHNCVVVGEDDLPNGETYPECKDQEYTFRHFASNILPGQYATILWRNYETDEQLDHSLISAPGGPGDRRVCFSALCYGKIYCMQETMSAYRHITGSGTSFSATHRYSYAAEELNQRAYLEFAYRINHPQAIRYAEMLYLINIRHAARKGYADRSVLAADKKRIRNLLRASLLMLKRDINYRVFHRTLHV